MTNPIADISPRKTAIIVGALFLIALFADLLSMFISENITLMLLEIIAGVAIIGIGVTMFPILKPHNKSLALGYLVCRSIEGVIFIVSAIFSATFIFSGILHLIYVYIFGLGALMLYYLLYQSKLVPRFISVWGLIAITLLLIANAFGLLGRDPAMTIFFALPIILNELFLAIWLIVKGFNEDAIASGSAKTDINNN